MWHLLIPRGSKPKDDQEFLICSTTFGFRLDAKAKRQLAARESPGLLWTWTWTASNNCCNCPSSAAGLGAASCLFARSLAESRAASIPKSPTAHLQYHYRPTNAASFPPSISLFEGRRWGIVGSLCPSSAQRFVDFSRADGPQVSQASRDILVPPSHTVSLKPSLTTLRPSEPLLFSSNSRWLQLSGIIN